MRKGKWKLRIYRRMLKMGQGDILNYLKEGGEAEAREISKALEISYTATSHSLFKLYQRGEVNRRWEKRGNFRILIYSLK